MPRHGAQRRRRAARGGAHLGEPLREAQAPLDAGQGLVDRRGVVAHQRAGGAGADGWRWPRRPIRSDEDGRVGDIPASVSANAPRRRREGSPRAAREGPARSRPFCRVTSANEAQPAGRWPRRLPPPGRPPPRRRPRPGRRRAAGTRGARPATRASASTRSPRRRSAAAPRPPGASTRLQAPRVHLGRAQRPLPRRRPLISPRLEDPREARSPGWTPRGPRGHRRAVDPEIGESGLPLGELASSSVNEDVQRRAAPGCSRFATIARIGAAPSPSAARWTAASAARADQARRRRSPPRPRTPSPDAPRQSAGRAPSAASHDGAAPCPSAGATIPAANRASAATAASASRPRIPRRAEPQDRAARRGDARHEDRHAGERQPGRLDGRVPFAGRVTEEDKVGERGEGDAQIDRHLPDRRRPGLHRVSRAPHGRRQIDLRTCASRRSAPPRAPTSSAPWRRSRPGRGGARPRRAGRSRGRRARGGGDPPAAPTSADQVKPEGPAARVGLVACETWAGPTVRRPLDPGEARYFT